MLNKKHQKNKRKNNKVTVESRLNKRGAPAKRSNEKKASNGLTNEQKAQVKQVAQELDISEAKVLRDAWDWYYTARENSQREKEMNERMQEAEQEEEQHSDKL